jgi:hypothetical protein
MKNSQKGFAVPLLIVISVLVIGGGVYYFSKNNSSGGAGIREINPQSFSKNDSVYFKYQGKVYYSATLFGGRGTPQVVDGADAGSFSERKLSTGQEYGVDKNFAYCAGSKLNGSDGPTFNDSDPNYAFDKNQAYYPNCRIIEGADGSSFQVIQVGTYAKDKNHVYRYGIVISGADAPTFQILGDSYMKDKNNVYFATHTHDEVKSEIYEVNKIDGADTNSFTVLKDGFAQDKNHKYLNGKVTTADYSSMKSFAETPYVTDNTHAYYNGIVLTNSDPSTFTIFDSYKYGNGYYAKDKSQVYFENNIVAGADPSSFVIYGAYANDKNFVFYKGRKIENSDGASFQYDQVQGTGKDKNYVYAYGCIYKDNKQLSCAK